MSENLLTSDGQLAVPGTTKAIDGEENMDTSDIVEDDLLGESDDGNIMSYQIPKDKKTNSEQNQSAFRNNSENETTRPNENPRKRRHGQQGQPRKKP